MSESPAPPPARPDDAATYRHAKREATLVLVVWGIALVYTLTVSSLLGYQHPEGPPPTVGGIPAWAFWGVFVPWGAAIIFTGWFCFRCMADDDLGADEEAHIQHGQGTLDAR